MRVSSTLSRLNVQAKQQVTALPGSYTYRSLGLMCGHQTVLAYLFLSPFLQALQTWASIVLDNFPRVSGRTQKVDSTRWNNATPTLFFFFKRCCHFVSTINTDCTWRLACWEHLAHWLGNSQDSSMAMCVVILTQCVDFKPDLIRDYIGFLIHNLLYLYFKRRVSVHTLLLIATIFFFFTGWLIPEFLSEIVVILYNNKAMICVVKAAMQYLRASSPVSEMHRSTKAATFRDWILKNAGELQITLLKDI